MKKQVVLALLALICITGCAALLEPLLNLGYARTYAGAPLSREEVAIVTHKNPYSQEIAFSTIDGVPCPQTITAFIELLPGEHTIAVSWANVYGSTVYKSKNVIALALKAQAGHTYIIEPNFDRKNLNSWNPTITDITDEIYAPHRKAVKNATNDYFQRERNSRSTTR